jgi:hypothetical protein
MTLKHKAVRLVGVLALSAALAPQAHATTLDVPSPAYGSFTDPYNFGVNSDAIFSFTGTATDGVGEGNLVFLTHGASLTSVDLLDVNTNVTTVAQLSASGSTLSDPNDPANQYTETTYTAKLGNIFLSKDDSYQLVFQGNSEKANSKIDGTIFLVAAPVVTTVPLPGATWLFLTGIMGFLGLSRSKKAA